MLLGAASGGSSSGKRTYKIEFDNAFGLVEGGDFRIGGVRAGQTTSFDVQTSAVGPPKAVVTAKLTRAGFPDFRRDATCGIKPQSLVGEYYVDCQPGSSSERLPDGAVIPVRQTETTIPADLVQDILRRPVRERLRLLVVGLGTGLAGRPQDLQAVLRRAHPGLRETSKALRVLGEENHAIERFIRDADTVFAQLASRKHEVVRFIRESGETATIVASRREHLRRAVRDLPGFLAELRPTMARLREFANEGTPLAADLQRAAPHVTTLFRRLRPFASAGRPALRALGDAARPSTQALIEGREEVDVLRRLSSDAPGTAKPLRQLVQSLDDRRRAVDDDPRAGPGASGPPRSDPSYQDGIEAGFTGFEAVANYFFWQSMTSNPFDAVGHMLRVGATTNKCSDYRNDRPRNPADEQFYRDCNVWLGPNQPGINAPDPSVPGAAAARLREQSGKPASKVGERRGPGEPDAGALPGQRDLSKPHVVLPPALQQLLDRLRHRGPLPVRPPPGLPPVSPGSGDLPPLLDFVLGP
jgi:phospholipid/cholesterol/gamma-HCH transport system substrate-binding protein